MQLAGQGRAGCNTLRLAGDGTELKAGSKYSRPFRLAVSISMSSTFATLQFSRMKTLCLTH